MHSLRLKRVLITGAAQGFGLALAHQFAECGAELVLTDINRDKLTAAQAEIEGRGTRCRSYLLDVTDAAQVAQVRAELHADMGRIDILVNNAGVVFGGPFLEIPLERHLATLRVNCEGMVVLTHAFLPDLIAAPRGHLVTIASASGFVGLPNGSTYAASKWAAIGFAESIRAELGHLGHHHVDVTTVCPTYIDTGMFAGAEPPKTARLLAPDELAAKVVTAVRERRVWVLEPWIVKLTPFLKNCLPHQLSDLLSEAFGANSSMDHWQGHAKPATPQR